MTIEKLEELEARVAVLETKLDAAKWSASHVSEIMFELQKRTFALENMMKAADWFVIQHQRIDALEANQKANYDELKDHATKVIEACLRDFSDRITALEARK